MGIGQVSQGFTGRRKQSVQPGSAYSISLEWVYTVKRGQPRRSAIAREIKVWGWIYFPGDSVGMNTGKAVGVRG